MRRLVIVAALLALLASLLVLTLAPSHPDGCRQQGTCGVRR